MLSGGEQQRVALARAVAPRPGVILMDEPFSNLDRRMRDAVREETVALLREMGATTIIVTHDPEEAMRIADRVVLMRAGGSSRRAARPSLYRRPADLAAARFFCDFNEVEGRVRGRARGIAASACSPRPACRTVPAVVCIRPQAVRLRAAGFCLPGRVLSRRFLGEVDLLEIAVQGLDVPLRARLRGQPAMRSREQTSASTSIPTRFLFLPHRTPRFRASHSCIGPPSMRRASETRELMVWVASASGTGSSSASS